MVFGICFSQAPASVLPRTDDRAKAARLLARTLGRGDTLEAVHGGDSNPLCRELIYGCLRHYFSLAAALNARLRRPLRSQDLDVYCLLLVGAYQLCWTRIPDHAAINETVAAADVLGKPWAKGLVNAVLRKVAASPVPSSMEHPPWLVQRLKRQYPEQAQALMVANNERAPMSLRINRNKVEPKQYRQLLRQAGIDFTRSWLPESVVLNQPQGMAALPGFGEGWVFVQDIGAQLVGGLIGCRLKNGQRLLDACAAPGGKLFHILECGLGIDATALDISPTRLATLRQIGQRLGHEQFNALAANAAGAKWWDGQPFDFVLLDAPCSGLGTLRRNPDIKVTRTSAQVTKAALLQAALLKNLWRTLRPGGTLLYCTCSILAEENDEVVESFMQAAGDASTGGIDLPTGSATKRGWQMLPIEPSTDGLYLALIDKLAG